MASTPNIAYLLTGLLLLSASRCADYPVDSISHNLDYLELHDPSGWVLHIDGDGGGRLVCRHMPGRRVVYLPETFHWHQSAHKVAHCHETVSITSPQCSRAIYFHQASNESHVCYCPEEKWMKGYFDVAFEEIRRSPAARKDRRLLQKAWLLTPPMAARGE